jgi:DNA replication protein DnaC
MLLEFQSSVKEHGELETIKSYFHPLTLFDDVAAHRISDFTIEMFGLLLERFYSRCIGGLIFTSNLTPRQILETMGERVASRLRGLAEAVEVGGKDWRLGKGNVHV